MDYLEIEKVTRREIIDSRGNLTVEAKVYLADDTVGRGAAPSEAFTGESEALELRDGNKNRFGDKDVNQTVQNINTIVHDTVKGMDASDTYGVDQAMIEADGTEDRSELGANVILAVSIAATRAASIFLGIPLHRSLGGVNGNRMLALVINIFDGEAHAANTVDVQEFMIMPVDVLGSREGLRWRTEVSRALATLLKEKGLATSVGDGGGLVPDSAGDEGAIQLILEAVRRAGYEPGKDFVLTADAVSSEWKSGTRGQCILPRGKKHFSSGEPVAHWKELCEKYPIYSIEDGLDEEDQKGWQLMTGELGDKIQPVGDDLFVTSTARLEKGISMGCANSVPTKLNQTGSVSETLGTIKMVHKAGYTVIASHRSGETEDITVADLVVALNTCQIKTGALNRSEHMAKYGQLLRIEEKLGDSAVYPEMKASNKLNGNGGGKQMDIPADMG